MYHEEPDVRKQIWYVFWFNRWYFPNILYYGGKKSRYALSRRNCPKHHRQSGEITMIVYVRMLEWVISESNKLLICMTVTVRINAHTLIWETIWSNKHVNLESKVRIYKACVRPLLTYAAETRAKTSNTRMMRTTDLKVLRIIAEITREYRISSGGHEHDVTCGQTILKEWMQKE